MPATNTTRASTPPDTLDFRQSSLGTTTGISKRTVSRNNVTHPSPAAFLSGQQFKNSRDPGARMAASGGGATAARGTASIDGTGMKPKP